MNLPKLDRIYVGDCLDVMRTWPNSFIQTCVTSPPYWGLRDYGVAGQLGLEKTFDSYLAKMVDVFSEVRRVLKEDGTLWLNLGDCFYNYRPGSIAYNKQTLSKNLRDMPGSCAKRSSRLHGFKEKDQMLMPHRVAIALHKSGWYARQTIIWSKPNPMPESVADRPTTAHEYLFLMAKSVKYYYDAEAIREPAVTPIDTKARCGFGSKDGKNNTPDLAHSNEVGHSWVEKQRKRRLVSGWSGSPTYHNQDPLYPKRELKTESNEDRNDNGNHPAGGWPVLDRNKRSVWTVPTLAYQEAHFATFPPDLIRPCILAGSRAGDIVLDPFMGAGTTALVAAEYDRRFLGIELNPDYARMAEKRIAAEVAQLKMLA